MERAPRIYTSESSHFSISRAAVAAGLGQCAVVSIPTLGRGVMDPAALRRRIAEDSREGMAPFAVVATAGTTGTGALDPLAEIADVCTERDLWFHVDACYGGAALLLEELRPRFRGIEHASSVALDPHKWFFCPLTASVLLFREAGLDLRSFDTEASYLPEGADDRCADPWRRGIPTSRRETGLTVWLTIRAHGWKMIRDAVRRNIELSRELEKLLQEAGFEVLANGELSIACARFVPLGVTPERVDELQTDISRAVIASGQAWFGIVRHQNRTWLSFRFTNLYTDESDLRALVALVSDTAGRLSRDH